jgi:hypothetical protein
MSVYPLPIRSLAPLREKTVYTVSGQKWYILFHPVTVGIISNRAEYKSHTKAQRREDEKKEPIQLPFAP